MSRFVLDCSVCMAWCFKDQADSYTRAVLDRIAASQPLVPSVWPLEVSNVLLVGERRRKLNQTDSSRFVDFLRELPIAVDEEAPRRAFDSIISLARDHRLSAYDAAYLELAMRHGLPLATRDEQLRKAARNVGVPLMSG